MFCNKVSGPSSVTRLKLDAYIRVVAWLGVNLRTDAKNASCVQKRLDCVLKRCQALSIVNVNWVEIKRKMAADTILNLLNHLALSYLSVSYLMRGGCRAKSVH